MRTRVVTVTPSMAFEWLKKNTRNRPLSQSRIERYANEMKSKDWELTGEPIKFTEDGVLIDGQHRLTACCLAKVPFATLVVEGIRPPAFNKIDQGGIRTLADGMGRDGKKHYTRLASAVRKLWYLSHTSTFYAGPYLSIDSGFDTLKKWPRVEGNLSRVISDRAKSCQLDASTVAAYVTFLEQRHGVRAWEFWEPFYTLVGHKATSPAYKLHNAMCDASKGGRLLSRTACAIYIIKAYNAHILGKRLGILRYNSDENVEFVK